MNFEKEREKERESFSFLFEISFLTGSPLFIADSDTIVE